MNVSEELARLAQLRDQGVLTQEEFETQKAAVLRGDHPATPEAKAEGKGKGKGKRKLGIGCLVVVAIIVVLMVIGALAGENDGAGSAGGPAVQQAEVAPREVTANELFNAYQANEAAAQKQFGDQRLLVSATIASIDLDLMDKPTLSLATSNQFMSAHAELTEASQAKASDLAKGQKVKLLCTGVSEVMSMPMLKDCEIQ